MADISLINWFLPVFSFLLVFLVVFAILAKTKILGDNAFVHILISLILAAFFVVNVSLVDFVQFTSSWFIMIVIFVFLAFVLLAFFPGGLDFLKKGWIGAVVVGLLVVFFVISAAVFFNWVSSWDKVAGWFSTDWFGFIILIIIAVIVAFVVSKK